MVKKETKPQNAEVAKLLKKISALERIIAKSQKTEELLKETQQDLNIRNKVLEALNSVAHNIYRSIDFPSLTREAIAAMLKYGKTATASMFEYHEDENCLIMMDSSVPVKKANSRALTQRLYLDKSAAGSAVQEKKIILCKDIATDPRILPATKAALLKEGRKSAVFIPLLFQDRVLGTINLLFPQKYTFADYELETLLSIGKTIGLAMANAKHIEQIKTDVKERAIAREALHKTKQSLSESQQDAKISNESLRIINAVADKIYLALDYDTLVKEAMEAIKLYGKTSAVIMFEYNENENTIAFLSTSAELEKSKATTVRLTSKLLPESLTAQTIQEKRIIICDNIVNDERINPEIKKWLTQKYNLPCVVSIPLLFRDKTLGVINLFFAEKYNFTDYELETLLSIGKTIGLAMANARYIQQIKVEVEERKIVQEALRQSEEKYRLLIENAGDAIFIVREGFVTYANPRALELLGYTMEELAQKPVASFLIAEIEKSKRKKSSIKSAYGIESFMLINKKNEKLSLDVHIVDIIWENKEASLYFGRDVTGQEKMEEQLYHAQKMEAIGTLAGGLAHDFNNLLMGIEGNTSLMLLQIPVSHPHYERLQNIEHYVTSGSEITAQLLGFARGGKYEVKPININKLVKKSASLFGRTKKEIAIHENFEKNIWTLEVDSSQIEQVLLNLFVNAGQAMPSGGNISLLTANEEMDENMAGIYGIKSGRYVKISVTDDGIGMDEETQRRLFDPFFTTKNRDRGTGLGLPAAYGIIKNHGGVITVYSEKGRGTTFNLYLPASEKEVAGEDTIAEDSLHAGEETILFVDDEKMIVDVGRDMLESIGYTVITAGSGKAALEIYTEKMNDIDLVILDLIMQELGGEATFAKLKEINPGVKVLLSSGYSVGGLANKLLDLGCRGFIQKPYGIKEFSARIREILDMK